MFFQNIIDSFHKFKEIIPQIVKNVIELSKSDVRILRFSFANIGHQFIKFFLG